MHSKTKGTTGELYVAHWLSEKGFCVFSEMGDLSKVDLIVLTPTPILIQVKSYKSKNDKVTIHFKKSGPNYSFKYNVNDFDFIALHVPDKQVIIWIDALEMQSKTGMTFNFNSENINQKKNVNTYKDYLVPSFIK